MIWKVKEEMIIVYLSSDNRREFESLERGIYRRGSSRDVSLVLSTLTSPDEPSI